MLAAALAASLADAATQGPGPAAVAAAAEAAEPAARDGPAGGSEAELAHYYGSAGAAGTVLGFGEHGSTGHEQQPQQSDVLGDGLNAADLERPADAVPPAQTSATAAQAVADAHAGQEAAAVHQPSLQLAEALGAAAANSEGTAAAGAPASIPRPVA